MHRHVDEPAHERDDVLRREDAGVLRHVDPEPLVELVAADLREVVALGIEEERAQQVARVVERRRLAGALLLEDLDQRLLLARRGVLLERVLDVDAGRLVEEREDRLVRRRVEREPGGRVLGRQRAQQRRDRQLALAVDAGVDDALLVDLELEPRAAGRHQVRGEDLLRRVLRLHQVGARRPHELRDDDALGAVDDERAVLGHHREVAHEDPLLADLARLGVDEADGHGERRLVGEVLLAALRDRVLRLAELVLTELDREGAGVVRDRRDVVDRLAEALVQEPLERGLLDVDQVGEVEDVLQTRKRLARAWRDGGAAQEQPPLVTADSEDGGGQSRSQARAEQPRIADTHAPPQPLFGAANVSTGKCSSPRWGGRPRDARGKRGWGLDGPTRVTSASTSARRPRRPLRARP